MSDTLFAMVDFAPPKPAHAEGCFYCRPTDDGIYPSLENHTEHHLRRTCPICGESSPNSLLFEMNHYRHRGDWHPRHVHVAVAAPEPSDLRPAAPHDAGRAGPRCPRSRVEARARRRAVASRRVERGAPGGRVVSPLTLLPDCVIPGCQEPVTRAGEVCVGCVEAFGSYLVHNVEGAPITAEQIEERDTEVREAYVAMLAPRSAPDAPERKKNQTCWLCEDRRKCALVGGRWECDGCRKVQP